jgi:hypothetical protein
MITDPQLAAAKGDLSLVVLNCDQSISLHSTLKLLYVCKKIKFLQISKLACDP